MGKCSHVVALGVSMGKCIHIVVLGVSISKYSHSETVVIMVSGLWWNLEWASTPHTPIFHFSPHYFNLYVGCPQNENP